MARGGWRRQPRDTRGRFASYGYTGQTGGRGARLTSKGNKRDGGGAKMQAARPAGTIGKSARQPKPVQLSSQQKRSIKNQQIEASRSASRNSARMGNVGNTPAQSAAYAKAAKADRAKADALGKQLQGQTASPTVFARSSRIKGEGIGGRYKGKGKISLYGKDLSKTKAARPAGTIKKPAGLKPGSIKPKAQATSKPKRSTKSRAQKDIEAAQRRLKTKQYGYTANANQALMADRRLASMTPQGLAASRVKTARYDTQRTSRNLRQGIADGAPQRWQQGMSNSLRSQRENFKKAAADYRLLNPKRKRK